MGHMIFKIITEKGSEMALPEDSEVVVGIDGAKYVISITKI